MFAFLQLVEQVNFREAVARLEASRSIITPDRTRPASRKTQAAQPPSLDDRAVKLLTAAAEVYHTALMLDQEMLAYVTGRGISLDSIRRFRIGYATGTNLAKYVRFRGWDPDVAKAIGLVTERGEFFRQRIILPEWRDGRAIYLTGRKTKAYQKIKYLGLPGAPKPLYGLELAQDSLEVLICEGGFDLLTLVQWGYPAVALLGAHLKAEWLDELAFAERVVIVTDSDEAGRAAAHRLAELFHERAIIVPPLPQAKDVNELALQPDGQQIFAQLMAQALRHHELAKVRREANANRRRTFRKGLGVIPSGLQSLPCREYPRKITGPRALSLGALGRTIRLRPNPRTSFNSPRSFCVTPICSTSIDLS